MSMEMPLSGDPSSVRTGTRLVLLTNDAMRARRRPRAILWAYVFEVLCAFGFAWPLSRAVASTYGTHPQTDAPLFTDGSLALLDFLVRSNALSSLASLGILVIGVAAFMGVVVHVALLTSIAYTTSDVRAPRWRHLAPHVVAWFLPMSVVMIFFSVLKILLAITAFTFLVRSWDDAPNGIGGLISAGIALLLMIPATVAHDLASAALIRFRTGSLTAIARGFRLLWKKKSAVLSWGWRSAAALVPVVAVAIIAPRFGDRTLLIFALHQVVIFSRVAFRASWLAEALRSVDVA